MKIGIVGINNRGMDARCKQRAMEEVMKIFDSNKGADFYTIKPQNGGVNNIVEIYALGHGIDVEVIDTGKSLDSWKIAHHRLAARCDKVYCITTLGEGYCYHCKEGGHTKAGGCLAIIHAKTMEKQTELLVI